ncbi:GNAT family N-acetyltransferase [Cellulosimicrobium cellulans]|uniref:GNAT family N-acetyltransferase n=1 Tax=Cellulosimicrobium cellulans TaxID=1710 RepID=UPI000A768B25|nr:GNAT family N-acetyltransferase [Cellulosimicrobium cellulans]
MTDLDLSAARVRTATSGDAEQLAALAALTFPLACPPGASPEAIAEHVATQLAPERFRAWAASAAHALLLVEAPSREGDRAVGYALLVRGVPDDADVADAVGHDEVVELSKIYVHPESQGTGVASTLMRAALDAAAVLAPGRTVWLGTNGLNARAQAFYRKHGFAVVGDRTYVVGGERHSDVVMVLGA